MNSIVQVRNPELYPETLKRVLDVITIRDSDSKVVGSTAYTNHRYPSDVDVFEQTLFYGSFDSATEFYSERFRDIIRKVIVDKICLFSDFKAGKDLVFEISEDTPPEKRRDHIRYLYRSGYLDRDSAQNLLDVSDDDDFFDLIREHLVLHWTLDEVLAREKLLPGGRKITLTEALKIPTVTKLDVISWINGRYQPVEVFYNLQYTQNGNIVSLFPLNSYTSSLLADIELYGSARRYQPLKLMKRIWILSRLTNCYSVLQALDPILQSDAAAYNQIVSDIETIWYLLDLPSATVVRTRIGGNLILMESPPIGKNSAVEPLKWLSIDDINRIYLEILGFGKRWISVANQFDQDLQVVYSDWLSFQQGAELNRNLLRSYLEKWDSFLSTEVRRLSEEFYRRFLQMNITCENPVFKIPNM